MQNLFTRSHPPIYVTAEYRSSVGEDALSVEEIELMRERIKQPGVAFPSAAKQHHLFIIRLDLKSSVVGQANRILNGLRRLCSFIDRIDEGEIKVDEKLRDGTSFQYPLSRYNFTVTIGFGASFFDKLQVSEAKRPKRFHVMPDHFALGDPLPYTLKQTDMLLQLGSTSDFVNRWVFQNDSYHRIFRNIGYDIRDQFIGHLQQTGDDDLDVMNVHDIESAVEDWALICDVHTGFQRLDGRNLMGFKDGISNPDRFNNDVIWIKAQEHDEKFKDGTFMVFQKIEHDLEKWRRLSVREQEKWVGRSKATGLLLGTLSSEEDQKLALDCLSSDVYSREIAQAKLQKLLADQRDPEKEIFNESDQISQSINAECPIWSHVRKSNPRGVDGVPKKIIFRRGYLFMDDGLNSRMSSGLLFICFQKDISSGFEYLKRNYLNNKNFPVPLQRRVFTRDELAERHRHARFSKDELKDLGGIERTTLGMDSRVYKEAIHEAEENDAQNTGRDGLSGPSKLGVNPAGEYYATVALGGGYYYVPPIPNKKLEDIAEQFLD